MADEWSFYIVLQADGALREPAYKALQDIELACGVYPHLRGCVDLLDGDYATRSIFNDPAEIASLPKRKSMGDRADYLKSGCIQAFAQSKHRKTCIIFSGHGTGVLTPVWDEQKQKWVGIADQGDSPFSRYCAAREYAFIEKIVDIQDQQLANCKSLFLADKATSILSFEQIQECIALSAHVSGKKIDIIGFDACSMAIIDVGYALKDHAQYLIASQTLEQKEGWCYDTMLTAIATEKNLERMVRSMVYNFEKEQRLRQVPLYSLAAWDLAALDHVASAIDRFVVSAINRAKKDHQLLTALLEARFKAGIAGACNGPYSYIDLRLFLEHLYHEIDALLESDEILHLKKTVLEVLEQLRLLIIAQAAYSSTTLGGGSVYFPHTAIDPSFHTGWSHAHYWRSFLDFFITGV